MPMTFWVACTLLQAKGDPISDRAREFEMVPDALARLDKAMEANSLLSQTAEPKFAHISPEVRVSSIGGGHMSWQQI